MKILVYLPLTMFSSTAVFKERVVQQLLWCILYYLHVSMKLKQLLSTHPQPYMRAGGPCHTTVKHIYTNCTRKQQLCMALLEGGGGGGGGWRRRWGGGDYNCI